MTPEQKAVILDAAQEMQHNDTWWSEFEWEVTLQKVWDSCSPKVNPLTCADSYLTFRRKPKTITVTMPLPTNVTVIPFEEQIQISFASHLNRDTALAAIREGMK